MSGLLDGKTALVMGVANRWSIAWAIAQAFSREGARLVFTFQGERQEKDVRELAGTLPHSVILPCDVARDEELAGLAKSIETQGLTLDALVHSIAFANRDDLGGAYVETSRAGFALALDVSAFSLVAAARHLLPVLKPGAAVVTLTYIGSSRVMPNYNVMGVAKAALESSVRYLASDLGPRGIRVNAISAGPIKTASARAIQGFSRILDVMEERAPLRRNTDPAEVADAAVFLCSPLSRGVTGEVLFVDNGFHAMGL
ncbi:MAG: enoyl-ACP reductase [Bacillati bacterium ANGP1]|uniref:Enoyl-[acyl-carrier-protein] reductase [NADH] n=1 Tax=Candidatus Segetimicrobium genomatis TaxID=2569760 RepID=A0A537K0T3_9BACT|nr:MAG: enoyl-ACP reductase [Terrabacteria group bacterium ANGP1]